MGGSFTLDDLTQIRSLMPADGTRIRRVTIAPEKMTSLLEAAPSNDPRGSPVAFAGVPIEESRLFPWRQPCGACAGTGEGGADATFCPTCIGAGAYQVDGMMEHGAGFALIISRLPRKIAVAWPRDVLVPLRAVRGVVEIGGQR
ncbi:hypothetical protein [Sphingomonas sp. VDB2]|uniref:hypothetical protein n=1 Tax=Sphingomonas sp. VDB2 TaxID=3228751 RepID=UPI003A802005